MKPNPNAPSPISAPVKLVSPIRAPIQPNNPVAAPVKDAPPALAPVFPDVPTTRSPIRPDISPPTRSPIKPADFPTRAPIRLDPNAPVVAPAKPMPSPTRSPVKPYSPTRAPVKPNGPPERAPVLAPSRAPIRTGPPSCSGVDVGSMSGDPHVYTFDGLDYDCQGRGEFIAMRAPATGARINTRLYPISPTISVVTGVAMQGDALAPVVEISYANGWPQPLALFVNGVPIANPSSGYSNALVHVSQTGMQNFDVLFTASGLRIQVYSFGMTVHVPCSMRNQTLGLLGSNDHNVTNDWMSRSGNYIYTLPLYSNRHGPMATQYCLQNWCVGNFTDSMFADDAITFNNNNGCNATIAGAGPVRSLQSGNADLKALCGINEACLLDGKEVGVDAARQLLKAEAELGRLSSMSTDKLQAHPSAVLVNVVSDVALTIDVSNKKTEIDHFLIYAMNSTTLQVDKSPPLVILRDVGSGVGNDTVVGDNVFSNVIPILSSVAGESFGFQAVPVIGGQSMFAKATLVHNVVRSYSSESGIVPKPTTKP
jgi:von Willebrand factor type D domain